MTLQIMRRCLYFFVQSSNFTLFLDKLRRITKIDDSNAIKINFLGQKLGNCAKRLCCETVMTSKTVDLLPTFFEQRNSFTNMFIFSVRPGETAWVFFDGDMSSSQEYVRDENGNVPYKRHWFIFLLFSPFRFLSGVRKHF